MKEIRISIDGSWQKRGHNLLNGIVTAVCHNKSIDAEIFTKQCNRCKMWRSKRGTPQYQCWLVDHKGSSGDKSSFNDVIVADLYKEYDIMSVKLECVGHVQKRLRTRLRNFVKAQKGSKKPISCREIIFADGFLVKKKKIRNGHRVYLRRLFAEIDDDLKEIKKINLLLTNIETKHVIIKSLDDEIMDLLADEDDIISEIEDTSSWTSDILSNIENYGFLVKRKGVWDQFSTAIDSNEDLSDIAKFNYLKSYLSGRAQKLIEGLTLSEGNYREAIQLLKDRFGNTQSLIAAHMDDFRKINPVRNLKEVKQLRQMYDKFEINIRNLKDLNVETCTYGSLLIAIISERIPPLCDTESNKVPNKLLSEVQSYSITHQNQHTATNNHVILQSAKATATNPDNTLSSCIRVLFDGCSHRTYITDALREKLKLKKISTESLIIKRFALDEGLIKTLDVVRVCLKGRDPKNNIYMEALCIPFICSPLKNPNFNLLQQKYVYLKGIPLAKSYPLKNNESVDILVGLDCYYSIITGKIIRGCNNGPVALESILGWIVCGPSDIGVRENFIQTNLVSTSQSDDDVLRLELRKFWQSESSDFQEQDNFYQQFKNDITFNGERYVTKLPLKPNCEFLPDNYNISLYYNYQRVYDPGEPGKVHYLPHRAVLRDDKETTKLRVVFDGSAKEGGPSINESLYTGPCLLTCIYSTLLRFRMFKIGLISDIRQAFLNVDICNEYKDLLRFLWYADKNNMLIIYRFLRVVFGITSSPFLLNTTIIKHMENHSDTFKEFTKKFLRDLYVDDSTVGVNTVSEGIQFYNFIKEAMKKGGFNLRKWFSNSPELSRYIADKEKEKALLNEEDSYAKFELNRSNDMEVNCVKVLGLLWNGKSDEFHFNFSANVQEALNLPFTKRNLLSVAKFYDPLGLISLIVVVTKLLFQALCIDKLDWDDKLPSEIHEKWLAYLKELEVISSITVPRYCFKEQDEIAKYVTLHGFSDSSQVAYSAVIYAQVKTKEGWMSKLITSKTKVAPIKKLTIPRLELLGCLLLANLMHKVVQDVLILGKICYWTDSKISLSWIKNSKRDWKLWVQHRVSKIQELSNKNDWSHIEGENNPADIPTRDLNLLTFQTNCLWWEGPLFLKTNITPKQRKYFDSNMAESISELKNSVTTCVNYIDEAKDGVQYIIKAEKFSSLTQLLRVSAYPEQSLLKGKNDSSQDYENIKQQLDLFIDEHNILRLKGRFENSLLEYAEKYPIILRSYSHFTKLIVLAAHERVKHLRLGGTLNELRSRFWIRKQRQIVKNYIKDCVKCKRVLAKTLHGPGPPNLPIFQVATHKFAFTNIGLDYAGPLFVKNIYGQENSMYKAYVCLFTCATSRNVHVELTPSMETDSLIRCLKRFIARRGSIEIVISDNFKTHLSEQLKQFLAKERILWKFILPKSPWWGGFYERLIRVVKDALKKCVGKSRLSYEELETVLHEIEMTVNSRPLTYIYDEVYEPLTPSHLVIGRRLQSINVKTQMDDSQIGNSDDHNSRLKYLKTIIDHYWKRFSREYIAQLRERHLYDSKNQRTKCGEYLQVGDVVLINDDQLKRNLWKQGVVEELIISNDKKVRGAILKTCINGHVSFIKRLIQRLVPLEVKIKNTEKITSAEPNCQRMAAITAELKRKFNT
ncbi:uncharacterized protein LOC136087157 [Hydra vulgaris]|uniref:Uncharacterized protein LOC136087157 n=1 Tax=Hydra vulgaris TaxID=6087 RepID=A0ABM4CUV3_HYDVU